MHLVTERLASLLVGDSNEFETRLSEVEKEIKDIDIGDVPQEDFEELYQGVVAQLANENGELVFNALKVLTYIANVETLVEDHFMQYVEVYTEMLLRDSRLLDEPVFQLLVEVDTVFESYTKKVEEKAKNPEYIPHIYNHMKQVMISLVLWLQDREEEKEKELEEDSPDRSSGYGVIRSDDTQDDQLRSIRSGLDLLSDGLMDKILLDEDFSHRRSELDPELLIMGRYNPPKHEHGPGCGCGHEH